MVIDDMKTFCRIRDFFLVMRYINLLFTYFYLLTLPISPRKLNRLGRNYVADGWYSVGDEKVITQK